MSDKKRQFLDLVSGMTEIGIPASNELRQKLGRDPSPGHLIDAALQLVATIDASAKAGTLEHGLDAAHGALYLLRELAVSQGYIALDTATVEA